MGGVRPKEGCDRREAKRVNRVRIRVREKGRGGGLRLSVIPMYRIFYHLEKCKPSSIISTLKGATLETLSARVN